MKLVIDAKIRKPAPAAEPTAAEAKEFGATLAASLFGDAPAPTPPTPPPPATKADVIDAFKKYAAAFDKTDDMAKAKFTLEDGPKILMQSVGVTRVSEIAEVDYGAAVKAVYFAIDNDLFSRMGAK